MGRKNRKKQYHPRRMEVWFADLPMDETTSIQGGSRPVLVISNDIVNARSANVTVAPITSQLKHLEMPTHVVIRNLRERSSMILAEQIMTVDKKKLIRRIGDCKEMEAEIEKALMEQIGIGR